MTNQDPNKRFAELVGRCWHKFEYDYRPEDETYWSCRCGAITTDPANFPNPNFVADPRLVLVEMMKREDWPKFCNKIGYRVTTGGEWDGEKYNPRWYELVEIDYILDTTGLLVKAAIEFLKAQNSR